MTRLLIAGLELGCAILLAGYALFQLRMARSLGGAALEPEERGRSWSGLRGCRWPPGLGLSVSLETVGWILLGAMSVLVVGSDLLGRGGLPAAEVLFLGAALIAHGVVTRTTRSTARAAFTVLVFGVIFIAVTPRPALDPYTVVLGVHVLVTTLWLGHMFFWSLISGPALKRLDDRELGARLRALSLEGGGLGWPALAVLIVTGSYLLWRRGIGPGDLLSPALLRQPFGVALDAKLLLVLVMVGYQAVFGHREAPRAIYLDMLVAIAVLALALVLSGV